MKVFVVDKKYSDFLRIDLKWILSTEINDRPGEREFKLICRGNVQIVLALFVNARFRYLERLNWRRVFWRLSLLILIIMECEWKQEVLEIKWKKKGLLLPFLCPEGLI